MTSRFRLHSGPFWPLGNIQILRTRASFPVAHLSPPLWLKNLPHRPSGFQQSPHPCSAPSLSPTFITFIRAPFLTKRGWKQIHFDVWQNQYNIVKLKNQITFPNCLTVFCHFCNDRITLWHLKGLEMLVRTRRNSKCIEKRNASVGNKTH